MPVDGALFDGVPVDSTFDGALFDGVPVDSTFVDGVPVDVLPGVTVSSRGGGGG